MARYTVAAFGGFIVPAGHLIQIDKKQQARLGARVTRAKGGFLTAEPVQFKKGEEFGTDAEMPPAVLQLLQAAELPLANAGKKPAEESPPADAPAAAPPGSQDNDAA